MSLPYQHSGKAAQDAALVTFDCISLLVWP